MKSTIRILAIVVAGLLVAAHARADKDWPGWRGPTGMGQSDERDLPVTWNAKTQENVLWKSPLFLQADKIKQDQNQSSPIVSGDFVFVTTSYWPADVSMKEFPEHHVVCFRRTNGERVWDTVVPHGPWLLKDLRGGYTASTPAADGARVYVLFGSSVLAALDYQGKLVWRKEITPHFFDVAIGVSPVLYRDTVLLVCDQLRDKKASCLLAFDTRSGDLKWEQKRNGADWTHSTPVLAQVNGKPQLLIAGAQALQGVDPNNGQVLWWYEGGTRIGDTVSPVFGHGLVYCDSGRSGPGVAVDPSGQGDVTRTHLKWKINQVPEGFSSPVMAGEYLFRLHTPETLKCWDRHKGQLVWAERLLGVSTSSSPFATPQGRVYCASAGTSYVFQAGPKSELLAVNELSDASQASPAVAAGRIYLKGRRNLYCIGNSP